MKKHTSIEYKPATDRKRVTCLLTIEIQTSARNILPLACPVEELRWIPNWEYQLLYSNSGKNETGCMFTEEMSGLLLFNKPVTTTWYTVRYDPEINRINFHLTLENKAVISFELKVRDVGDNLSACTWEMVFTALDSETNRFEEKEIKSKVDTILTFISQSLKTYCETGHMPPS